MAMSSRKQVTGDRVSAAFVVVFHDGGRNIGAQRWPATQDQA